MAEIRRTHAQNVADTSRSNTAFDQKVDELLRVLRLAWAGQWSHFEQFSASNLTKKGESIAKAMPVGFEDRNVAAEAIRAGY
jgi:hypothetical protein